MHHSTEYNVFFSDDHPVWDTLLSKTVRHDDVDALAEFLILYSYRLKGCEKILTLLLDKGAPSHDVRERQFARWRDKHTELNRLRWGEGYTEEELASVPGTDTQPPDEVSTYLMNTVISLAIRRGSPAITQRLVHGGADVHVGLMDPNDDGLPETPLHIAANLVTLTPWLSKSYANTVAMLSFKR
jgi:hypothetical protein